MRLTIEINGAYDEAYDHYYEAEVVDVEGLWATFYLGVQGHGDNEMDALKNLVRNCWVDLPNQKTMRERVSEWNRQVLHSWAHLREQLANDAAEQITAELVREEIK